MFVSRAGDEVLIRLLVSESRRHGELVVFSVRSGWTEITSYCISRETLFSATCPLRAASGALTWLTLHKTSVSERHPVAMTPGSLCKWAYRQKFRTMFSYSAEKLYKRNWLKLVSKQSTWPKAASKINQISLRKEKLCAFRQKWSGCLIWSKHPAAPTVPRPRRPSSFSSFLLHVAGQGFPLTHQTSVWLISNLGAGRPALLLAVIRAV